MQIRNEENFRPDGKEEEAAVAMEKKQRGIENVPVEQQVKNFARTGEKQEQMTD